MLLELELIQLSILNYRGLGPHPWGAGVRGELLRWTLKRPWSARTDGAEGVKEAHRTGLSETVTSSDKVCTKSLNNLFNAAPEAGQASPKPSSAQWLPKGTSGGIQYRSRPVALSAK